MPHDHASPQGWPAYNEVQGNTYRDVDTFQTGMKLLDIAKYLSIMANNTELPSRTVQH